MGIFFVSAVPTQELALTGPSEKLDDAHWPARGDLAHIRLAGKVFVPHYAVPIAYTVSEPAKLLNMPRPDGALRDELVPGMSFNVLDIAGKWAWGQLGETAASAMCRSRRCDEISHSQTPLVLSLSKHASRNVAPRALRQAQGERTLDR